MLRKVKAEKMRRENEMHAAVGLVYAGVNQVDLPNARVRCRRGLLSRNSGSRNNSFSMRFGGALSKTSDAGKDVIGRFDPNKWFGLGIGGINEISNRFL